MARRDSARKPAAGPVALQLAAGLARRAGPGRRVHTGVHYPGDIVIGSLIGEGTGQAVAGLIDRLPPSRWSSRSGRNKQQELPEAADAEGLPG
jgi:hypothetical protein